MSVLGSIDGKAMPTSQLTDGSVYPTQFDIARDDYVIDVSRERCRVYTGNGGKLGVEPVEHKIEEHRAGGCALRQFAAHCAQTRYQPSCINSESSALQCVGDILGFHCGEAIREIVRNDEAFAKMAPRVGDSATPGTAMNGIGECNVGEPPSVQRSLDRHKSICRHVQHPITVPGTDYSRLVIAIRVPRRARKGTIAFVNPICKFG